MLTVTNPSGQTEIISKFNSFEMYEETNGAFTLSFISFFHPGNPGHSLIDQECIVEYEGYEFRIKQLRSDSFSKQVTAVSTYFDRVDDRKYDTYGGTHTFDEFATYLFEGTGLTFINEDIVDPAFIPNFGNDNIVKLTDILKNAFQCEMKIEPNDVLRFAKKIGPDNDTQYRYGHNIITVSENIDTTKLKTYIEGFGANGLHVEYTSPYASIPGIGIRHAEPVYDDRFTQEDSLLDHIKKELHDYPETIIELDAIELQDKELGERVWLIHERLGIEYQTRVMSKRTRIPKHLSTVTLGNVYPKTISGILASQKIEIDRNRTESRSKIEQTNDKIQFEVSRLDGDIVIANSKIIITADEIRSEVTQAKTELDGKIANNSSLISQTADTIRSEVSAEITRLDGIVDTVNSSIAQTASEINLRVDGMETDVSGIINRLSTAELKITDSAIVSAVRTSTGYINDLANKANTSAIDSLNTRLIYAESSITQNANNIASRVSQSDYNGNIITSLINQSATTITLSASKIDLNGITSVNSELNIGNSLSGNKFLRFRGISGTTHIMSPSYAPDSLIISAMNGVWISSSDGLYVGNSKVSVEGHTHSGYALTNHTHSGYASSNHSHSTNSTGGHNHGLPDGWQIYARNGSAGTAMWMPWYPAAHHSHTIT